MLVSKAFKSKRLAATAMRSASNWGDVPSVPPDPILGVLEAFNRDTHPNKVMLGVGAYRDDDGKPWVLPCVREAEKRVISANMGNEYAGIVGIDSFVKHATKLAYQDSCDHSRVAAMQSLSGTGSLRVGMEWLKQYTKEGTKMYLPDPTWANHRQMGPRCGLELATYRYFDNKTLGIDINGMLEDLEKAPKEQIIMLHACAHNPTGADPTTEEWKKILEVSKRRDHIIFFDMAYQGFASGDPTADAYALQSFVPEGLRIVLAQSFAKSFGLYGQRVGNVSVLCENEDEAKRAIGQLKIIARTMYSNPPIHGGRIVDTVLGDEQLLKQWHADIKTMSTRIKDMRQAIRDGLVKNGSTHNWDHIVKQIGMFAFTGLKSDAVNKLINDYHIYLTQDGRISLAGLNTKNVDYVANAFHEVTK